MAEVAEKCQIEMLFVFQCSTSLMGAHALNPGKKVGFGIYAKFAID